MRRSFCLNLKWMLLSLFLMTTFIALGFWQIHRANEKQVLSDMLHQGEHASTIHFSQLYKNPSEYLWRQVQLTGRFDNRFHFLLDNQIMQGKVGYFVLTPFLPTGSLQWVLVNQGWVPLGESRQSVVKLISPEGEISIEGVLKPEITSGILLSKTPYESLAENVFRIQLVKIPEVSDFIDQKMFPYVIRLLPESEYGYVRNFYQPSLGKERNLAYAMQWFLFALMVLVGYICLGTKLQTKTD